MTLYTGSIAGGGSAGLIAKLEECLALHPTNWEFIEEVTVSGKQFRIWKNKGHVWNGNIPFYFYIYTASTSSIALRPFEEWDAVNKKCIGLAPIVTSGSYTLDAKGRLLAADPTNATNHQPTISSIPASIANYTYYIKIAPQGIFINTSLSTADGGYLGLIEPSGVYESGEFPLINYPMVSGTYGFFTRVPGLSGSVFWAELSLNAASDAAGVIPTGLPRLGGKSVLARRRVKDNQITRGFLPEWLLMSVSTVDGIVSGDTITIDSKVYCLCKNSISNWVAMT